MQIKISELFLKEFINPDLDVMDGRTPERDGSTITNEPKKNGDGPADTDTVNQQARYGPLWNHRYGIGISESENIEKPKLSKELIKTVYQADVFLEQLNELLKGFVRLQKDKSPEQYNDIIEIVLAEINKVYDASQETLRNTDRD